MRLFIIHAANALGDHPAKAQERAKQVLREALKLHADTDLTGLLPVRFRYTVRIE